MRIGGLVGSSIIAVSLVVGGTAIAGGHKGSLKDGVVVSHGFKWDGFSIGIGGGYGWADVDRSSELEKKKWYRQCKDKKIYKYGDKTSLSNSDDYYRCYKEYETGYHGSGSYKHKHEYYYEDPVYKYSDTYHKNKDLELEGALFTAQIGLDRRLGSRFVGGLFADFDKWLSNGEKVHSLVPGKYGPYKAHGDLELDYTATVGARLGILVHNDSTLIYGLAGYTWAQFEDIHWQACHYRKCYNAGKNSLDASGFTLGAGIERKFNDRVSLKAEYRYTDLDEEGFGWDTDIKWKPYYGPYGKSHHYKQDYDTDMHSVRVLLSFKLGHDRHTPLK